MSGIVYAREPDLPVDDYIAVVGDSALGEHRPLDDRERIARLLAGSNVVVTARLDGQCIGLARGVSDGAWVCYLADLAVRDSHQGRGIGRGLLLETRRLIGPDIGIALLALTGAVSFYDRIGPALGMAAYPHAYWWERGA